MSTNFPASKDTYTNPIATSDTNTVDHAGQHANINDAMVQVETKLGTGASTPAANTFLIGNGAGTSAWQNLTSAQLLARITDATGSGSAVFATSPTLTTPTIASIINTGTLTLPTATDTLVGRTTTDTLINKTISGSSNTLSNIGRGALGSAALPDIVIPLLYQDGTRSLLSFTTIAASLHTIDWSRYTTGLTSCVLSVVGNINTSGTFSVQFYNVTDGVAITGSSCSTTSTGAVEFSSADFHANLPSVSKQMAIQSMCSANNYTTYAVWLTLKY